MALGELLRSKKSSLAFYYNLKQNESWSGKFLITYFLLDFFGL